MIWVIAATLAGVGALVYALLEFSLLALAFALVALPLALIMWRVAKGVRDASRDA